MRLKIDQNTNLFFIFFLYNSSRVNNVLLSIILLTIHILYIYIILSFDKTLILNPRPRSRRRKSIDVIFHVDLCS